MQEKDIVLDGQNVAFCHGKTKAKELKRKGFFSYDGLKISATTLYNNGYRAKIILPEFWCRRNKTKRYDGAQEVIEYLCEKELIIEVKGDEADQIDDVCALGYAHDNNLCLISNDHFKKHLKGLEQNLLEHWSAWINKNTIKFDFIGDTLFLNRKTLSIDYVDVAKGAGT